MARLTPVFAATTLAAALAAGIFWQQLHKERARTAQLQERINQLEQQHAAAPTIAQVAGGSASPAPEPSPVVADAPAQTPPPPVAVLANPAAMVQDLARDPEFCNAQKSQMRAALPQTYPDAAKALGLSQAESTALFDLLARQQEGVIDMSCGPPDASRQRPSGQALAQAQEAELKALLGAARFGEWQEYLPTREGRVRVNQLRTALAMSDTPLSEAQVEPLLATVLTEGKRRREETSSRIPPTDPRARLDFEEETIKLLEESHARLIGATQAYLSPQQVAVMRNSMANQVSMQKALLRARRAQMEAGSGPP